jgi:hypothetical protein
VPVATPTERLNIQTEAEYAEALNRANQLRSRGDAADQSAELAGLEASIQAFEAVRTPERATPGRPGLRSVSPKPGPVLEHDRPEGVTPPRAGLEPDE